MLGDGAGGEAQPVGETGGGEGPGQFTQDGRPTAPEQQTEAVVGGGLHRFTQRGGAPGLEGDGRHLGVVGRVEPAALREDERHEHERPLPRRVLRLDVLGQFEYGPLPARPALQAAEQRVDALGGEGPGADEDFVLDEPPHHRPVRRDGLLPPGGVRVGERREGGLRVRQIRPQERPSAIPG
ncbi:hypothetical protein [Streptomyces sp. NPDC056069]|uniref:hypothetical protein n=1 Tax=Streptomyces sp. NPDC056069 TaxID=3345702 RepID=UPI0035DD6984